MSSWDEVRSTLRLLEHQLDETAAIHAVLHKQQCDVNSALWDVSHLEQSPCVQHPAARIRQLGQIIEDSQALLSEAILWIAHDYKLTTGEVVGELYKRLKADRDKKESIDKNSPKS